MKLFKKQKSKFYWYDFTVRSRRYRGSTQETKSVRALQVASLKLASVMGNNDALPSKPSVVQEFAQRFLDWVNRGRLEEKTRKFYRNGWRLLKDTSVAETRIDRITSDYSEQLKFPGSAANANCALRTLRRMLHKAEEWKMIGHGRLAHPLYHHPMRLPRPSRFSKGMVFPALASCSSVTDKPRFRQVRCRHALGLASLLRHRPHAFHHLQLLPSLAISRHGAAAESLSRNLRTGAGPL